MNKTNCSYLCDALFPYFCLEKKKEFSKRYHNDNFIESISPFQVTVNSVRITQSVQNIPCAGKTCAFVVKAIEKEVAHALTSTNVEIRTRATQMRFAGIFQVVIHVIAKTDFKALASTEDNALMLMNVIERNKYATEEKRARMNKVVSNVSVEERFVIQMHIVTWTIKEYNVFVIMGLLATESTAMMWMNVKLVSMIACRQQIAEILTAASNAIAVARFLLPCRAHSVPLSFLLSNTYGYFD